MPKPARRYYTHDDEPGVTPSQLKRMGKARQAEYLIYWFGRHYEDPAEETPYESAEGGYQWIWGGPYDAREELFDEFGDFISEEVIERVAEEIEADGHEWAPGPEHPTTKQRAEDWRAE